MRNRAKYSVEKFRGSGIAEKLLMSAAFLYLYVLVFSNLLPPGINMVFSSRLAGMASYPLLFLVLFYFAFIRPGKRTGLTGKNHENFDAKDISLLFIPMLPVSRYAIVNSHIMQAHDYFIFFAFFLLLSFILTFAAPAAAGGFFTKPLAALGLSFSFLLFNMPSLASYFGWHFRGALRVQLQLFGALFLVFWVLYEVNRKIFRTAAFIFFISGALAAVFSSVERPEGRLSSREKHPEIYNYLLDKNMMDRPDVFLLTYESYVGNETMLQYGIDNSAQEDFLLSKGFHIYPRTYTVGPCTLTAMSRVLDISNLRARNAKECRRSTAGGAAVHKILGEQGYKTCGIFSSDYFFRGVGSFYDYSFPEQKEDIFSGTGSTSSILIEAVLEGEFRFDAAFDRVDYGDYLVEKRKALAYRPEIPRFIYTHNKYPGHSQNSGRAIGNELEVFEKGLGMANAEMRKDIEIVVENNPDAVVIVCGDHGPYLTKNCTATGHRNRYSMCEINRLDVQDRYGCFLAIRWPDDAAVEHEEIKTLQDVFPVVFAELFAEENILKFRIEPVSLHNYAVSGVVVRDGIIEGGVDDGKPLFERAAVVEPANLRNYGNSGRDN